MPCLATGASAVALAALSHCLPARAQQAPVRIDIRPQPLGSALRQLGRQAQVQLVFDEAMLGTWRAPRVAGTFSVEAALSRLLQGSGFGVSRTSQGVYVIVRLATRPRAAPPTAPPPAPQVVPAEPIVVTGTRLIRPDLKAASPVTTAAAEEIRLQGAVNLEEVLNRFPQVTPDSQQLYQNSNGRQRVKLRGLDFNRTLVLIDGQRITDTEAVDINLVPASLVQRIDVLTGGASSVYGSDAVAGVVNFVLRKNFEGIEVSGTTSFYQHDNRDNPSTPLAQAYGIAVPRGSTVGGERVDLNATVGHNFLDGRLNLTGFVGHRRGDPIFFRDRDISGCQIQKAGGGYNCLVTAASPNGTITPLSGPFANQYFSNASGSRGTFVDAASVPGYSNSKDREALRGFDRWNLGGFFRFEIAPAAELYGNVLYARDLSRNSFYGPYVQSFNAYGSTPYQVNCDNPLMSAQQAQIVCGTAAGGGTLAPLNVQIGFPGLGGNRSSDTFDNRNLRLASGARGVLAPGLRYDVSGVFARNRALWLTDGKPVFAKVNRALDVVSVNGVPTCRAAIDETDPGCVPLDIFVAGSGSPALRDYLFDEARGISDNRTSFVDLTGNLTADLTRFGIVSPWAAQGLALVVGGEFRRTSQNNSVNDRYVDVYGGKGFVGSQAVYEGNVEAQLPLVAKRRLFELLQLNGGYRRSKYDLNRRTFATWKIEGVWSPVPDITVRAGLNRAQRAPSIYEGNQTIAFSAYNVNDFCAPTLNVDGSRGAPRGSIQACRASGLADALYGSSSLLCPDQMCRQRTGGFELAPEDARTLTAGLVLTPSFVPRLSLTGDYYRIRVDRVIGFNYANFAVDGCVATADPYYCTRIVRNPDGTLFGPDTRVATGYIQAGTTNQYRLNAEGVDVSGEYRLLLGSRAGRIDLLFTGSRTIDSGGQDSVVTPARNCTGYFGPRCGQPVPAWIHVARGTYMSAGGVFSASLAWRFIGGTRTTLNSTDPAFGFTAADRVSQYARIPDYSYLDLAFTLALRKRMVLTMSANNLFDRMPPVLANSYATALSRGNSVPQRYDILGRQLSIGVTSRF
jgi:iron complex outermembrane recepter protein